MDSKQVFQCNVSRNCPLIINIGLLLVIPFSSLLIQASEPLTLPELLRSPIYTHCGFNKNEGVYVPRNGARLKELINESNTLKTTRQYLLLQPEYTVGPPGLFIGHPARFCGLNDWPARIRNELFSLLPFSSDEVSGSGSGSDSNNSLTRTRILLEGEFLPETHESKKKYAIAVAATDGIQTEQFSVEFSHLHMNSTRAEGLYGMIGVGCRSRFENCSHSYPEYASLKLKLKGMEMVDNSGAKSSLIRVFPGSSFSDEAGRYHFKHARRPGVLYSRIVILEHINSANFKDTKMTNTGAHGAAIIWSGTVYNTKEASNFRSVVIEGTKDANDLKGIVLVCNVAYDVNTLPAFNNIQFLGRIDTGFSLNHAHLNTQNNLRNVWKGRLNGHRCQGTIESGSIHFSDGKMCGDSKGGNGTNPTSMQRKSTGCNSVQLTQIPSSMPSDVTPSNTTTVQPGTVTSHPGQVTSGAGMTTLSNLVASLLLAISFLQLMY
ncbi:MAG: hypothetical protein ACR2PT_08925 [Endozoicomonas sp.]